MADTHRHVVRFTLDTLTPLSVGTGFGSGLFDTELVRDANGLPTIPGTALAGVLSALYRQYHPEKAAEWRYLFGDEEQNADKSHGEKGQASRLGISFGCIHDQHDRAVEGLLVGAEAIARLQDDPLLQLAARAAPLHRDHVAIDHRGTAKEQQKFDRTSLPTGYRFSFEIAMWGGTDDMARLVDVVGLIKAADFRLGGASRRGLGRLRFACTEDGKDRLSRASFDLSRSERRRDFASYRQLPIDETPSDLGFETTAIELRTAREQPVPFELKLRALDFWRFGQGTRQLSRKNSEKQKDADSLPLTEVSVTYASGRGMIREAEQARIAIPASAVKGALLHRAEFHLNCLKEQFADTEPSEAETFTDRCTKRGMDAIAGSAKLDDSRADSRGFAGLLLIDDAYVEQQPQTLLVPHNSIDRFSGGVMDGRLFVEEVCYSGCLTITLTTLMPRPGGPTITDHHREALDKALSDLCEGRLALGADGHGYFEWAGEGERPSLVQAFGRAA